MDRVHGSDEAALATSIEEYLEGLVGRYPVNLDDQFCRAVDAYNRRFSDMLQHLCTTCPSSGATVTNALVVRFGSIRWGELTDEALFEQYEARVRTAWLRAAELKNRIARCLQDPATTNIVVPVITLWGIEGDPVGAGHMSLMIFQKARRLRMCWDPHAFLVSNVARSVATVSDEVSGYSLAPPGSGLYHADETPLQSYVEGPSAAVAGQCGLFSMIVAMLCLRFNYFNPKHVAKLMMDKWTPGRLRVVVNQFSGWVAELDRLNRRGQRLALFASAHSQRCCVYNPKSAKVCSRRGCATQGSNGMCWQHRWILENRKAAGPRGCSAPKRACTRDSGPEKTTH